jgi:hypothetical protein
MKGICVMKPSDRVTNKHRTEIQSLQDQQFSELDEVEKTILIQLREMEPKFRNVCIAMIRAMADEARGRKSCGDFIWRSLDTLVTLTYKESKLLENTLRDTADQMSKAGNVSVSEKLKFWAHEIMMINCYRNDPSALKNVICCHVPRAHGDWARMENFSFVIGKN